jgi:hypothetical protein
MTEQKLALVMAHGDVAWKTGRWLSQKQVVGLENRMRASKNWVG